MSKDMTDRLEEAMAEAANAVERLENEKDGGGVDEGIEEEVTVERDVEWGEGEAPDTELLAKHQELKDQLLRMAADFDNFRKRARRDVAEQRQQANQSLLLAVLPILDNLERAMAHVEDDNPVAVGVKMVVKQFVDVLGQYQVARITSVGQVFDPEFHEALSQLPTTEYPAGAVVNEIESGYTLHGKLLRAAKVVVATAVEVEGDGSSEAGEMEE